MAQEKLFENKIKKFLALRESWYIKYWGGAKYTKEGIPTLKAAYAEEGIFVGADKIEELASIKSKNELIADIVALLQSPTKNVLSALQSGASTIHGVLKTLGERPE